MMLQSFCRFVAVTTTILACLAANTVAVDDANAATLLSPESFFQGMQDGLFDVIVDVRTLDEWNQGHIAGATLVESLSDRTTNATAALLAGCEYCNMAVYCSTGARATQALAVLQEAGFVGQLYNGLGVTQWTQAGYPLTTDQPSVVPPCTADPLVSETCKTKLLGQIMPGTEVSFREEIASAPPTTNASSSISSEFILLAPDEIYQGIQDGSFGVILDVRTDLDWNTTERLPNSTVLSELFASNGGSLNGCEYCDIVVYGDNTMQAEQALSALLVAGFKGTLYNGQAISDYQTAGYDLDVGPSVVPACVSADESSLASCYSSWQGAQEEDNTTTAAPTIMPTTTGTSSPVASPTSEPEIAAVQGSSESSGSARSAEFGRAWMMMMLTSVILFHALLK